VYDYCHYYAYSFDRCSRVCDRQLPDSGRWSLNHLLLRQPSDYVVILGGALGGFIADNHFDIVKASLVRTIGLIKPPCYNCDAHIELVKRVFDLLVGPRKGGLLKIELDIIDPAKSPAFPMIPQVIEGHQIVDRARPIFFAL